MLDRYALEAQNMSASLNRTDGGSAPKKMFLKLLKPTER